MYSGKRGMQKRVVAIPIKDIEGMKLKGDQMISSPPSDSWTWRKYGQKPIKGSPYPRYVFMINVPYSKHMFPITEKSQLCKKI